MILTSIHFLLWNKRRRRRRNPTMANRNSYKNIQFTTKNKKKHKQVKGKKWGTYPLWLNLPCRLLSGLSLPVGVSLRSAPEVGVTYTGFPIFYHRLFRRIMSPRLNQFCQKRNSWTAFTVKISGHQLESSQSKFSPGSPSSFFHSLKCSSWKD